MIAEARKHALRHRLIEALLLMAGIFLVGRCAWDLWEGHAFQAKARAAMFARPERKASARQPIPGAARRPNADGATAVLGSLQIPALGFSVMVVEGDGDAELRLGAGHLRATPLPGSAGNSVIAGHRDTFFYALRKIQKGTLVRFANSQAVREYRVREVRIVDPQDVSLIQDQPGRRELTLVTCYPFTFVGPAPKRMIVVAE